MQNFAFEANNLIIMRCLLFVLLFIAAKNFSQCKTYKIGMKGDTLNCTDNNNHKQGKWTLHVESLRGEPGFEEEGIYKNDKKEGVWRTYNLMGDLLSIEEFKWGFKNGTCSYYSLAGLVREESWKAIDPLNPYDTVKVYDLKDHEKYNIKIVKVESSTVKHGIWKYYNPLSGKAEKTEEYVLGELLDPDRFNPLSDTSAIADNNIDDTIAADSTGIMKKKVSKSKKSKSDALLKEGTPKEVLEYEKKNTNKKKIKVREGQTGVD